MQDPSSNSVTNSLGVVLQRGFRTRLYAELTEGVGDELDSSTYPVISALARMGPSTAAALGAEIGLDRSIVSRRAARLTSAGYLTTGDDPRDARATVLSLTPGGRTAVALMRKRLDAAVAARMANWSPAERRQFAALLNRFASEGPL